jgi:hypothetical protein
MRPRIRHAFLKFRVRFFRGMLLIRAMFYFLHQHIGVRIPEGQPNNLFVFAHNAQGSVDYLFAVAAKLSREIDFP